MSWTYTGLVSFFKKNKFEIFVFFILSVLYFLIRLYRIKDFPIFNDEAIYIHWAQNGLFDTSRRLDSLLDGKQPLFIWTIMLGIHFFGNPFIAGRFIGIFSGFFTMAGIYLLSYELFKDKKISLIACALFVFYPFALVMNRIALYENVVGFFDIFSLYLGIKLVKNINLGQSLLLAQVLGAGILNKSTGFFNIYLLPALLIFTNNFKDKFKFVVYAGIAVMFALLYYSVIQLAPSNGLSVDQRNGVFLYSIGDLLGGKFFLFPSSLIKYLAWIIQYFAVLAILLVFFSFLNKGYKKGVFILFFWFAAKLLAFSIFGEKIFPRYFYPVTLTLFPLSALGIIQISKYFKQKSSELILLLVVVISMLFSDYKIITNLPNSPIPEIEKFQYVNGWPAGVGVREIVNFLQTQAQMQKITVLTEGSFTYGSMASAALDMYFFKNPNFVKIEYDSEPFRISDDLIKLSKTEPVYVLFNRIQNIPKGYPLKLIMEYRKGTSSDFIRLYKIEGN